MTDGLRHLHSFKYFMSKQLLILIRNISTMYFFIFHFFFFIKKELKASELKLLSIDWSLIFVSFTQKMMWKHSASSKEQHLDVLKSFSG